MSGSLSGDQVLAILEEAGVWRQGHFLLTSGRHSSQFWLMSQATQRPRLAEGLCRAMAAPFRDQGIAAVVGPAMGGVILAYEVARALDCRALFTEKDGAGMALKRGFTAQPGERVLVVEDIVTTGGSVRTCIDALRPHGVALVAVSVIVDRSEGLDFGVPLHSLVRLRVPDYAPADCPLCAQGVPVTRPKA